MQKVLVIGAGPAGLVMARYLKSEGFEPALFEQGGESAANGEPILVTVVYGHLCAPTPAAS